MDRGQVRRRGRASLTILLLASTVLSGCVTVSLAAPSGPPSESAAAASSPSLVARSAEARADAEQSLPTSPWTDPDVLREAWPSAHPAVPPAEPAARTLPGADLPSVARLLAPHVPVSFDVDLAGRLQRIVERVQRRTPVPGLSVAVRLPSGEVWTGVAGEAALDPGRPVTRHTVFAVGSITKTFVAALILQLAEEGALSLDDTLDRFVPDAPKAANATLRHLLNHRSGIYNYFEHPRYNRQVFADTERRWRYEEIMALVRRGYCKVDACFHYSNTNYVLLGRVAEVVTGRPLHELLRERFFDPLGLRRTVYQPEERTPSDAAHGHWRLEGRYIDHTGGARVIPFMSAASVAGAAGAIASTPADLVRWTAALFDGEVLSPTSLAEMTRFEPPLGYGLGARTATFAGHQAVGHGGSLRGFESAVWHFPTSGVTIALTSNRGLWLLDAPLLRLVRAILEDAA